MTVAMHVEKLNISVEMITPEHVDRSASPEFNRSVARLKKDGHHQCWICGTTEDIQIHHLGCEWSEQNDCDLTKLGEVLDAFDPLGYNRANHTRIITSVDQIYNMLPLCQKHHTGVDHVTGTGTGIHNMPFGWWIMQKIGIKDPIPQDGESIEQAEGRME